MRMVLNNRALILNSFSLYSINSKTDKKIRKKTEKRKEEHKNPKGNWKYSKNLNFDYNF